MDRIDLHAHTTASDGTLTPAELVAFALEREVDVIAVTDHDTVDGIADAQAAGSELGVRVVAGIELSCRHAGRSVHVLGLLIDPRAPVLDEALETFRAERVQRGRMMVERLNELGYALDYEDVLRHAGGRIVARPHIARALVDRGHVSSVRKAFTSNLIADGGRADVPRRTFSPQEAVDLVRRAGGAAVIAHPGAAHHEGPRLAAPGGLIEELAGHGLAGIEVDHPDHPPDVREELRSLASQLDLVPTGGSDCHGREGTWPGTCLTDPDAFRALQERTGVSPAG